MIEHPINRRLQDYWILEYFEPFQMLWRKLTPLERALLCGRSITKCKDENDEVVRRFPLNLLFAQKKAEWATEYKDIMDFV